MNSEGRFIGKGGELLNIFQRNFNLSLITKVSNDYGVKKTDGSWTGMIDDILKKRVDVCMYKSEKDQSKTASKASL